VDIVTLAFITFRIDYCTPYYMELYLIIISTALVIQNDAARTVKNTPKYDRITINLLRKTEAYIFSEMHLFKIAFHDE